MKQKNTLHTQRAWWQFLRVTLIAMLASVLLAGCTQAADFSEKLASYGDKLATEEPTEEPAEEPAKEPVKEESDKEEPKPEPTVTEAKAPAEGEGAQPEAAPAPPPPPPPGPVVIKHMYGEATFQTTPTRVVALTEELADALVVSQVIPVGIYYDVQYALDLKSLPDYYTKAITELGGQIPENFFEPFTSPDPNENPFRYNGNEPGDAERLKRFQPDMILADTWNIPNKAVFDRFNAVAPTVVFERNDYGGSWIDRTVLTASIFGKTEQAQAAVNAALADVKARGEAGGKLPGKTYMQLDHECMVKNPSTGAGQLMTALGMVPEPKVASHFKDIPGTAALPMSVVDGGRLMGADFALFDTQFDGSLALRPWTQEGADDDCTVNQLNRKIAGNEGQDFDQRMSSLSILNIRARADELANIIEPVIP